MITIPESFIEKSQMDKRTASIADNERLPEEKKAMYKKYYMKMVLHGFIILWGAIILILQFVKFN